jgi:long-chain acyl-CoA synthetase
MYQYHSPDNLVELLENSIAEYGNKPLFGTKNREGVYEWVTYTEVGKRVDCLRSGLARLGVGKNDAVGMIANNRVAWAICAFATFGLGGRFIPMYEKELKKTWKYIIDNGDIKILMVANSGILKTVKGMRNELQRLEEVFVIDDEGERSMAWLEREGEKHPTPSIRPDHSDIAVLIYTSGTTGDPKGVLLSHGNFTTNSRGGSQRFDELNQDSRALSILPWAHSYAQTAELYTFISLGASIGIAENVDTIAEDLQKVKPTFLIAVPRVFNKIYDGLWAKMNETGGLARTLFDMGVKNARRKRELALHGKSEMRTNLKVKIADAVVFKKIRQRFGGQLMGALTASATMNVDVSNFFNDIGIPVYDCYGLTETSPAVTMSSPGAHRPGSVGRPIEQVRVEIDQYMVEEGARDGEIVVFGPNVMQGYHKNAAATQAVMTPDGGFRTGDRGYIDDDGFLFITGRIKEQYKLQNGKYVFPAALEGEIRLLPFIENAMVYGEGRAFNVCLVVPEINALKKWAERNDLKGDEKMLIRSEAVQEMIRKETAAFLKGKFGGYEIPRRYILLKADFSLDSGTLTQTMKLKRRVVLEQFAKEIEAAYAEA